MGLGGGEETKDMSSVQIYSAGGSNGMDLSNESEAKGLTGGQDVMMSEEYLKEIADREKNKSWESMIASIGSQNANSGNPY